MSNEKDKLFSMNTEMYVIKVMFNRQKSVVELSQKLKPDDFYYQPMRYLFTAIKKLSIQGDLTAEGIMTLLENENKEGYEVIKTFGGTNAIEQLRDNSLPESPSVELHVETLKSFTYRRNLVDLSYSLHNYALTNVDADNNKQFESVDAIDERVKEKVHSIAANLKSQNEDKPIGDGISDLVTRIKQKDNELLGIDIGYKFPRFNKMIKRLQNARVIALIADAKAAKSTMMLDVSWLVATSGYPVLFGDSELTEDEVRIRLLAKITGLTQDFIREGQFVGNEQQELSVDNAVKLIEETPFYWSNLNFMSNSEIESTVKLHQLKHGIKFFCWDYIKADTDGTDGGRIDKVMDAKLNIAKEKIAKNCNIPVLTALQTNPNTGRSADSYGVYRIADAIIDWKKVPIDQNYLGTHKCILNMCRYGTYSGEIFFDIDGARQTVSER